MGNYTNYCIVLSPAKTLRSNLKVAGKNYSEPVFLDRAQELVKQLKTYSPVELKDILGVSQDIADLNFTRYANWHLPFTPENSTPAILTFAGDLYEGLQATDFTDDELAFSNRIIFMLSGLYGVLRAFDLMQPYRLEMGSKIQVGQHKSLYDFWGDSITGLLDQNVSDGYLVNLASKEYSRAINDKHFGDRFITIEFKENRPEGLKVIPILSKRARGLMARFAVKNKIVNAEDLKLFDYEGYGFSDPLSTATKWVFVR
ncbi:MAG TPA: peroxide stress protein YaaA [Tenuifilum sp.]|uniref:peroxide stress protein YaaA n=1 Tax=Tenuifilum sp. TaxID=2760880 RepID=UPI002CB5CA2D|nr:peroxide stress protein YaaA [Tenuifilum sp.]